MYLSGVSTLQRRNKSPKPARRVAVATAIAIAGAGIVAGSASAASTPWIHSVQTLKGKAEFRGHIKFYSAGDHHGGFRVKGTLYDENKKNDRGVKFMVKKNGYNSVQYKAPTDKNRVIRNTLYWDGAVTVTRDAYIRTCQMNRITPDDCTKWRHYVNPYYPG